ncbi:bifunctional DNA primase/polymerase [Roseivivax marinus]|uniref:bifunctional DNA primase/polymerase n=1 Tax=Roseivivax marinus TaxID=1379903 RepID=UPI00273DC63E|nr:bifunctional DNA primase/polymerase [Roseivivax marinus]
MTLSAKKENAAADDARNVVGTFENVHQFTENNSGTEVPCYSKNSLSWPYSATPEERAALFRKKLLSAALDYAENGYPVFPAMMVEGQKKPLVKWGKGEDGHPILRMRRATTDPVTIKAWWARWPLAMIGMPTGERSGVVVLDVDRKCGVDGLANLRVAGLDPFTITPIIALTPSGGLHFFMRYSGPLKNSAGLLAAGVDVRGDGGYIVLPPSLPSIERDEYQWNRGRL